MKKLGLFPLCTLIIAACLSFTVSAGIPTSEMDFVMNQNTEQNVLIPLSHRVDRTIEWLGEEYQSFKNPQDLFLSQDGYLYVCDTGNNRIVKLNANGQVINVYTGPADKPLRSPSGIYVDDNGDCFIGDTGNSRILHVSSKGEFVEEFTRPESDLLSENVTFDPSKVYVGPNGFIYLIKGKSFMMLDSHNQFKGYIGTPKVGFDIKRLFVRFFASDEQKRFIYLEEPDPFTNFTLSPDGMIYATSLSRTNQIVKINAAGENVYPQGNYGVWKDAETGFPTVPSLKDIAVNSNEMVYVVDGTSCRIFVYTSEGEMLCSFGGEGKKIGCFQNPTAIAVDKDNVVYVLDKTLNNIQVFSPTTFMKDVQQAIIYHNQGDYKSSKHIWESVLETAPGYPLGHKGLGKSYYKEKKYDAAMHNYYLSDDIAAYSQAFDDYRNTIFRKYFVPIVLAILVIIILLKVLITRMKRLSDKISMDMFMKKR